MLSDDFTYVGTAFSFTPALPQHWANEWYLFGHDGTLLVSADRGGTPDATELGALKTAIDTNASLAIMAGSSRLDIKEGGTAPLRVKLSEQPAGTITVTVARRSGDADITVSGATTLTFTTANWNTW